MFKNTGKESIKLDNVKKKIIKYKHPLVMLGILAVFLLGFLFIRFAEIYHSAATIHFENYITDSDVYDFYKAGDSVTNEILIEEDVLSGLRVGFDPSSKLNAGFISVVITDLDSNSSLFEGILDMSGLNDNYMINLMFDESYQNMAGHTIRVSLEVLESESESDLKLLIKSQENADADIEFVNGFYTSKNTFIMNYFILIWGSFTIFALLLYGLVFIKKAKIETVFLVSILCLGFIYSFLITPYSKPDETVHIDNTYYFSNKLLGITEIDDEHMYKRQTDADVGATLGNPPNITTYKQIYEGLWEKADNTELVAIEKEKPYVVPIVYGPGILGVTLARILNLNSLWMLMLGTWFNLVAFALLVYFGMKKLPFGKMLLFLIATMPMSIQQAASFSYDAVINGVALFFTCYCLQLIYEKEKVGRRDIIIIPILSLLLCWGKGGAYVPLVFLILLIPRKKFNKNGHFYLWIAGILAILAAGFLTVSLTSFMATNGTVGKIVEWADLPGFTISDVIADPKNMFVLFVNTFFFKGGYYMYTFIGEALGSLNIHLSMMVIFVYFLIICLSAFREEKEKQFITVGHKLFIGILSLGSIGLILLSMLLDWTPKGFIFIEGVQGRYFIPLGLAMFLLLRNNHLVFKKACNEFFIGAFLVLQVTVLYTLIQALMH